MSVTAFGIVTAVGQSEQFFAFRKKHFSVTNKVPEIWNSETERDFEVNLIHRFNDTIETDPSDGLTAIAKSAVMDIVDMVISKSNTGTLSTDKSVTEAEFSNAFPGQTVTFESIITDTKDKVWPTSITITNGNETITLYLYPPYFEVSYPNSNVVVVSLLENVDDFGTITLNAINRVINELDTLKFSDKFMKITEEMPCTAIEVAEHKWVSRSNLSETTPIPWGLVCYGKPSIEAKEKAIREFINNNGSLSKSDKETIFPSLYGSHGYNLFPFWNNIAFDEGRPVYSPIGDGKKMAEFVAAKIQGLNGSHVMDNWELLPTVFQSLLCLSVPDVEQLDDIGKLRDNISRYILIPPTSGSFTTMDSDTQDFVRNLFEALAVAETYPTAAEVSGIEVEQVGGLTYITFFSNGLRWRVLTKDSYTKTIDKE